MQRISSEFAGFVRDTGVRAFDRLSETIKEVDAPLRPVLRAWAKLNAGQKNVLFDELIATVGSNAVEAEVQAAASKPKPEIHRYDPEEVEPTLPVRRAKPKKKAAPKKR
jgi:hypothetical protein